MILEKEIFLLSFYLVNYLAISRHPYLNALLKKTSDISEHSKGKTKILPPSFVFVRGKNKSAHEKLRPCQSTEWR